MKVRTSSSEATVSEAGSAPAVRATSIAGTYYRFHPKRFFQVDPRYFHKNFIDTRGGHRAAGRFAPAQAHCGHYFAATEPIALAEMLYYEKVADRDAVTSSTPERVLQLLRRRGDERLFLAVSLRLSNLLDLTDAETVDALMRSGSLRATGRRLKYQFEVLNLLLSQDRGGNAVTDALGIDARTRGYSGVLFPSVRSMHYDGDRGFAGMRFNAYALEHMSSAGEMDGSTYFAAQQLEAEYNVVVFSGERLTSAITALDWLDVDGDSGTIVNPLAGATPEAIEQARLEERSHRGLGLEDAAREGLLSVQEAEALFANTWLPIKFHQPVPFARHPSDRRASARVYHAARERWTRIWTRVCGVTSWRHR